MRLSTLLRTADSQSSPDHTNALAGMILSGPMCLEVPQAGPETPGIASDPDISSIHYRSDQVKSGGLFVAIPGFKADGHDFIDQAIEKGAAAVVVQKPIKKDILTVRVKNTRNALSSISARFYNHPSEKLNIVGITGTNGKTTTACLIENMFTTAGLRAGLIGTIDYRYAGKIFDNPVTTPESADLQEILSHMKDEAVTHVVMEVSSHALELHRIDHLRLKVGIFTNLSQDHLDFHHDMESYFSCKKKLFTKNLVRGLNNNHRTAVINCNSEKGLELLHTLDTLDRKPDILTIGDSDKCHIRVRDTQFDLHGIRGFMSTPSGAFELTSSLVGHYNLENIMCAVGAGIALGLPLSAIQKSMENFPGVPGRLELVKDKTGRFIFVDYAHTPDALQNVLSTLKSMTPGRLISVFGCGGDRDRTKRSKMGEVAGRLSDLVMITSDNPRTEDPMKIIEQIKNGIEKVSLPADSESGHPQKGYLVEPDRKKAIQSSILSACSGDTVLIAGKGHETYQVIGDKTIPFDDRTIVQQVLEANKKDGAFDSMENIGCP